MAHSMFGRLVHITYLMIACMTCTRSLCRIPFQPSRVVVVHIHVTHNNIRHSQSAPRGVTIATLSTNEGGGGEEISMNNITTVRQADFPSLHLINAKKT